MRLTQLNIRGFRGFKDLKVNGLRQVNLIIGRNDAGKTSLLEAIYLLEATDGDSFVAICRDVTGIWISSLDSPPSTPVHNWK